MGEIGEIYSRMAEMADFTYHNKPEKRAEIDRDGFITSGDVGYIDEDGYVFICDRKRDMVISGGVNIYPAEIESVLHAVPGVHDCAVFGIPDAEFGEALMAVVEPQPGVTLDASAISVPGSKASLADYKVPKHIEIRTEPAARGLRKDLQAPPARSLLGAGGAEDLVVSFLRKQDPVAVLLATARKTPLVKGCRARAPAKVPHYGLTTESRVYGAPPPSSSCAAAKKAARLGRTAGQPLE